MATELDPQTEAHLKGWHSFARLLGFSVVGLAILLLLIAAITL
jgi:hypothetical protein